MATEKDIIRKTGGVVSATDDICLSEAFITNGVFENTPDNVGTMTLIANWVGDTTFTSTSATAPPRIGNTTLNITLSDGRGIIKGKDFKLGIAEFAKQTSEWIGGSQCRVPDEGSTNCSGFTSSIFVYLTIEEEDPNKVKLVLSADELPLNGNIYLGLVKAPITYTKATEGDPSFEGDSIHLGDPIVEMNIERFAVSRGGNTASIKKTLETEGSGEDQMDINIRVNTDVEALKTKTTTLEEKTSNLDENGRVISHPTEDNDIATKEYVDQSGGGGGGTPAFTANIERSNINEGGDPDNLETTQSDINIEHNSKLQNLDVSGRVKNLPILPTDIAPKSYVDNKTPSINHYYSEITATTHNPNVNQLTVLNNVNEFQVEVEIGDDHDYFPPGSLVRYRLEVNYVDYGDDPNVEDNLKTEWRPIVEGQGSIFNYVADYINTINGVYNSNDKTSIPVNVWTNRANFPVLRHDAHAQTNNIGFYKYQKVFRVLNIDTNEQIGQRVVRGTSAQIRNENSTYYAASSQTFTDFSPILNDGELNNHMVIIPGYNMIFYTDGTRNYEIGDRLQSPYNRQRRVYSHQNPDFYFDSIAEYNRANAQMGGGSAYNFRRGSYYSDVSPPYTTIGFGMGSNGVPPLHPTQPPKASEYITTLIVEIAGADWPTHQPRPEDVTIAVNFPQEFRDAQWYDVIVEETAPDSKEYFKDPETYLLNFADDGSLLTFTSTKPHQAGQKFNMRLRKGGRSLLDDGTFAGGGGGSTTTHTVHLLRTSASEGEGLNQEEINTNKQLAIETNTTNITGLTNNLNSLGSDVRSNTTDIERWEASIQLNTNKTTNLNEQGEVINPPTTDSSIATKKYVDDNALVLTNKTQDLTETGQTTAKTLESSDNALANVKFVKDNFAEKTEDIFGPIVFYNPGSRTEISFGSLEHLDPNAFDINNESIDILSRNKNFVFVATFDITKTSTVVPDDEGMFIAYQLELQGEGAQELFNKEWVVNDLTAIFENDLSQIISQFAFIKSQQSNRYYVKLFAKVNNLNYQYFKNNFEKLKAIKASVGVV